MRWFHRKTYGQPDSPTGHNLPPIARSNSLNYWKKALSFYMPNRLMVWDEINKRGNSTILLKLLNAKKPGTKVVLFPKLDEQLVQKGSIAV
jgi:hypothetical protein